MIEHDEKWFSYYEGVLKDKPEYKVGHVLQNINSSTGYAVITSIIDYKIVGKCYTIITDFGHKLILTEREVDLTFIVVGWQDVL